MTVARASGVVDIATRRARQAYRLARATSSPVPLWARALADRWARKWGRFPGDMSSAEVLSLARVIAAASGRAVDQGPKIA